MSIHPNTMYRRGLNCLYKSTIRKMPECQAYGCKNKTGEARRCETIEILPYSKCENVSCEARIGSEMAAQH